MLNIPANANAKERGIQNHFSLVVPEIKAAVAKLKPTVSRPPTPPKSAATANGRSTSTIPISLRRIYGVQAG